MTSRAPQTKTAVPASGAKKLSAPAEYGREAAPSSVKRAARNLLNPRQMTPPDSPNPEPRGATAQPGASPSTRSGSSPSSRKVAMSNKTAPAKDTTQEYREDSSEDTAVRRSPQGTAESSSEEGPEEAPDMAAADAGGFASEAPPAGDPSSDGARRRTGRRSGGRERGN